MGFYFVGANLISLAELRDRAWAVALSGLPIERGRGDLWKTKMKNQMILRT